MEKKIVMLVAPSRFKDEELFEPRAIFQESGIKVDLASKDRGEISGTGGRTITANKSYVEINPDEYDAIVFVGGSGAQTYFTDRIAIGLAKEFYSKKKIVAAICIAPTILANAGILNGKNVTAFATESSLLRRIGAEYTGEDVVIDGRIITAKGPAAASQFADAIVKALGIIRKQKM